MTGENDKKKSSKGWKRHKHGGRWHLRKLQKLFNMRWTSRNVKILSIQTDANAGCLDPTSNRYLKEMKVKNKEKRKQEDDNQRAENEERGIRARGCISYRNCFIYSGGDISIIPQSWKDFEFSEPLIETTRGLDDSAFDGNKTKYWMNLFGCHNPCQSSIQEWKIQRRTRCG